MVLLLFSLLIILPTIFSWGTVAEKNFNLKICDGISGKLFSGIFCLTVFLNILSFFTGFTIYLEILILFIGLFFFIKNHTYKDFLCFFKKTNLLFYVFALICIFCASFYPFILDHFGYYVPTIKWLREFGLVKGISNLDLTLGQMSSWHILQSGFSHLSDPFLRINLILLIAYLIYIFETKRWLLLSFVPAMLLFSQSPSPDLPAFIFSLIIINEILGKTKINSSLLAFGIFAFTIKPTMIWLPLFIIIMMIIEKKISLKAILPGFLIFGIYIIKNLWVFGYPLFPMALFDLNLPWKPNPEIMKMSSEYALLKTYDAQYSLQQIAHFSFQEKITNWLFLQGIKSVFNIGLIIFLLFYGIFSFIKKEKIHLILFLSLVTKSILIISFSAQYRFFLDVFPIIILAVLYSENLRKISFTVCAVGSLLVLSFFINPQILRILIPSFRLGNTMGKFEIIQFYKPSEYQPTDFESFKIGNVKVNVSKKYPFNFETPVPAISESFMFNYKNFGISPQLIDSKNLKRGFIWKKLSNQEKKELDNAIKTIQSNYQQEN